MRLGNWKTWNPHERWVVYLLFGLMAVIAFQVFIKHTTDLLVGYLDMPKCHQEQFCMWKECSFQTVKLKKRYLVIGNLNE
jgi:hypothetical protein